MHETESSSPPKPRVPWFGRWGVFGISWFAMLGLFVPLVLGGLMFGEMHRVDTTMDQSSSFRVTFIVVGAVFLLAGGLFVGIGGGLLTFLITLRRWYFPPTAVFLLGVLSLSGMAYIGMQGAIESTRAEIQARADLERVTTQTQLEARRQIEESGFATPNPDESRATLDSIRAISETASDPNEAEIFAIAADIGERINGMVEAYHAAMGPYLEVSFTDVSNDVSEEELLDRIDAVERANEKNDKLIRYLERMPAILKTELTNRTTLNAATRDHQAGVFLDEFNYDDVLLVRRAEGEFLDASREQLMILLDTHGLWEIKPDGFEFAASVDDSYLERFDAAYQVIQRVAAEQMAAQRRMYGMPEQP